METQLNYHIAQIVKQDEIHIVGAKAQLEKQEIKSVADKFGVEGYQLKRMAVHSGAVNGGLEYYSYILSYGNKSYFWNEKTNQN